MFFSPFSIVITSLGEERAILSVFRSLFDLCMFGSVWEGLWLVIVALPGLFSYLFFYKIKELFSCIVSCFLMNIDW